MICQIFDGILVIINSTHSSAAQCTGQIRKQMSGPDLHVFTLKFLQPKKVLFSGSKKIIKNDIMQLFIADTIVFSNHEKPPSKVAHTRPRPFYFTVQSSPDHSTELIFHTMKSWDQTSVLLSVTTYFVHKCATHIHN